jgi:L-cysteine S-thiosulfotransferase
MTPRLCIVLVSKLLMVSTLLSGCAHRASTSTNTATLSASFVLPTIDYRQAALDLMKLDFASKGAATLERTIEQDSTQRLCSEYPENLPKEIGERIEQAESNTIRYPLDGRYLGDFKNGEIIAQNGRGLQFSDAQTSTSGNGGNCYACHQMSKTEISYGNIGPSLYQYGKLRGQSEAILKYTWGKIYNPQAFRACSNMPRFGHNGILQENQIQDLMALLLDLASPINQ